MRILLTGKNGQVGSALLRTLAPLGELVALDRTELDLVKRDQIVSVVRSVKPDVLVNAAAYTAVDQAESEPDVAQAINAVAAGVLAEEAKRAGALLVHYSTDYVFDGTKAAAYIEDDPTRPLNAYGLSKLAGERAILGAGCAHLILRTSWVYARQGKNFLQTVKRLLKEKKELRVVADQFGAPTFAEALAQATAELIAHHGLAALKQRSGVYHATASGSTSWHGFATEIARLEGIDNRGRVVPISSDEYPTRARRPRNSRLSNEKLFRQFGVSLPSWEVSLLDCYAT